jgi:uncharacterized protein (TIGR02145 family)
MKIFLKILLVVLISSCNVSNESSNDLINNNVITIGSQVWIKNNLDVDKFKNGDPIPQAKSKQEWLAYSKAGEAAWCYYDNNIKNNDYGKLYNWFAVNDSRGIAPSGFHVPSNVEYDTLIKYLGGNVKSSSKLKSNKGWTENCNGTNSTGFNAIPSGGVDDNFTFQYLGSSFFCWSITEDNYKSAYFFNLDSCFNSTISIIDDNKSFGFSIRCLKDK